MHLLRQECAARRQDPGNLSRVERGMAIEHEIEFAIGERHRVIIGQPHREHLRAMRGQAFGRQGEVRRIIFGRDHLRRPMLSQAEESLTAARVQINHRGRTVHQLSRAREIGPGVFLLEHPAVQMREIPAGKRIGFFPKPLCEQALSIHASNTSAVSSM